jgi:hypothetical protein
MTTPTRKPFTIAESARVRGGTLIAQHGPNCASRSGGECGCIPTYRLQRVWTARGR